MPALIARLNGTMTRQARTGRIHSHQLNAVANRAQASDRFQMRASSYDTTAGVSRAQMVIAKPVNADRGPSVNIPRTAPTKGNAISGARLDRNACGLEPKQPIAVRPSARDTQDPNNDALPRNSALAHARKAAMIFR